MLKFKLLFLICFNFDPALILFIFQAGYLQIKLHYKTTIRHTLFILLRFYSPTALELFAQQSTE